MQKQYDLAIIGGGILGTTLAYWLSTIYEGSRIVVLEKEHDVALHTSGRNTGVIHRPFYLDPATKKTFARAALHSYSLWKTYAKVKQLPWKDVGTIEIAVTPEDVSTLKRYREWSLINGMDANETEILSAEEVRMLAPMVVSQGALYCKTDAAVDFGVYTKSLSDNARQNGVTFFFNTEIVATQKNVGEIILCTADEKNIATRYCINAAGGGAIALAHHFGVAKNLTDINFRGEYWIIDPTYEGPKHNIYSVPRHHAFPFLDPHWIVRANEQREIGPTAVPVIGAYTYEGFAPDIMTAIKKIIAPPWRNTVKLLAQKEFLQLALEEWRGILSPQAMVKRVQRFLPTLHSSHLIKKGVAGVRSSLIDRNGKFVKEVVEYFDDHSCHILNFNSPGATGAPAYTAMLIQKLISARILDHLPKRKKSLKGIWDFDAVTKKIT